MVDFAKMREQRQAGHQAINQNLNVSIAVAGSDYAVSFGYDRELVGKLTRGIPDHQRRWIKDRKCWLVDPAAITEAANILQLHTGQLTKIPADQLLQPETYSKSFTLEYLGTTKDRGPRRSAYGFVSGDWNVEIPEDVLKGFFEGGQLAQSEDGSQTLYQILCISELASGEDIKKAYKRLARQWHPDTCHEPDAHERFIKLNDAYSVLIDPEKKARYDAGLYFERKDKEHTKHMESRAAYHQNKFGYRAPLRCGLITATGTVRLMRFIVSEIVKWDDVTNEAGQVMTASWPKDGDTFQISWV